MVPPINEGLRVTESLPMAVINSFDANDAIPLGSRSVASLEPLQGYEDAQDGERSPHPSCFIFCFGCLFDARC